MGNRRQNNALLLAAAIGLAWSIAAWFMIVEAGIVPDGQLWTVCARPPFGDVVRSAAFWNSPLTALFENAALKYLGPLGARTGSALLASIFMALSGFVLFNALFHRRVHYLLLILLLLAGPANPFVFIRLIARPDEAFAAFVGIGFLTSLGLWRSTPDTRHVCTLAVFSGLAFAANPAFGVCTTALLPVFLLRSDDRARAALVVAIVPVLAVLCVYALAWSFGLKGFRFFGGEFFAGSWGRLLVGGFVLGAAALLVKPRRHRIGESAVIALSVALAVEATIFLVLKDHAGTRIGVRRIVRPTGTHDPYEFILACQGSYDNPFDAADVAVRGEFVAPSGRKTVSHGFLFADFTRELEGGCEKVRPLRSPSWRVRFTPTEPGRHRAVFEMRDRFGIVRTRTVAFGVADAQDRFIRVSACRAYFTRGDTVAFFPTGHNVCWPDSGRGTFEYDEYFAEMRAAGENFGRIWLGPWFFKILRGGGTIDLREAWKLDSVMRRAAKNSINLTITLDSATERVLYGAAAGWPASPLNVENGGPVKWPEQTFSDTTAKRHYRRKFLYASAMLGEFPNLFAWELMDEADMSHAYRKDRTTAWIREMAAYVKRNDPRKHPVSVSFYHAYEHRDVWRDIAELDFSQGRSRRGQETWDSFLKIRKDFIDALGKPFFMTGTVSSTGIPEYRLDPTGLELKEMVLASVFARHSGAVTPWWWKRHIHDNKLYRIMGAAALLMKNVDVVGEKFVSHDFKLPVRHRGLKGRQTSLIWIADAPAKLDNLRIGLDWLKKPATVSVLSAEAPDVLAEKTHDGKDTFEIEIPRTSTGAALIKIVEHESGAE